MFDTTFQPGDVLVVICGKWTSKVINSGEHVLGQFRWARIILEGMNRRRLSLETAYRVYKGKSSGIKTAYKQQ